MFTVDGQSLCGPGFFIVGLGKCGTNAFAAYLHRHPSVMLTQQSEIVFDPASVDPIELVKTHGANVTAVDPRVLVMKHNLQPYQNASVLTAYARRLRATFPQAAIGITLCDPAWYGWRWWASRTHPRPDPS